ncbi:MAG: hypothetical protein IPH04_11405 [Saprospirales bacterium]|nr:hypothetical protein [Saprospirales bacterium]
MERIIRIGIPEGSGGEALQQQVLKTFQAPAWQCLPRLYPPDELHAALLSGEIECSARALHELPATPREGIVNAALIDRAEPAAMLIMPAEKQSNGIFRLPKEAVVYVAHPALGAQLGDFRPDLRLYPLAGSFLQWESLLREAQADALLLNPLEASLFLREKSEDFFRLALNPREICPQPGLGAIVLQTLSDDLPTRRLLQSVHRPELSARTNVERKLLRLLGGELQTPLGAFCERDAMGHYHLFAAYAGGESGRLRRVRQSSSTTSDLADLAFAALQ